MFKSQTMKGLNFSILAFCIWKNKRSIDRAMLAQHKYWAFGNFPSSHLFAYIHWIYTQDAWYLQLEWIISSYITCTSEVFPTPGAPTRATLMWLSVSLPHPFPVCACDFSGIGWEWLVVTCHSVCESRPWPPPQELTASTIIKKLHT